MVRVKHGPLNNTLTQHVEQLQPRDSRGDGVVDSLLGAAGSATEALRRCAKHNTVVAVVASGIYVSSLGHQAPSAARFGFGCVVTQPYDQRHAAQLVDTQAHRQGLVQLLPVPPSPLLPRLQWCEHNRSYGWRRTHLYKVYLWRQVMEAGYDLLSLDANWLIESDPLPILTAARARGFDAPMVDVIAHHDGEKGKLLNIGMLWIRNTPATRMLVRRVENRTWGAWDQYIFNEELNFNVDFAGIRCCHTPCLKQCLRGQPDADIRKGSSNKGDTARRAVEGPTQCATSVPQTLSPPLGSLFYGPGAIAPEWKVDELNAWPTVKTFHLRREGRCTWNWAGCLVPERLCGTSAHPSKPGQPPVKPSTPVAKKSNVAAHP